ncbi:Splicing factor U2AF 65 kDa subunit [Euphorbia peplus]|nr:Splicing factor U2AF 65 kDa subunit [Euphorbia peplus]
MSRSSQHKERHGRSSGVPLFRQDEGTAARTRPLSFEEIMSRREKKKKQFDDEKEGTVEDVARDSDVAKVSDRDDSRIKDSSSGVQKHLLEGDAKPSSRKKKENTSVENNNVDESKDRRVRDSKTKLKSTISRDLKTEGRIEEQIHGRRKIDERQGMVTENEALNKHSRDVMRIDRNADGTRQNFERASMRNEQNVIDERNRDRHPTKKNDVRKGHDNETSDRKEIDERNRDRYPTKKHDAMKGHDRETSYRKEIDERIRDRHPTKIHDVRRGRDRETSDRKEIDERNRDRHLAKEYDARKGHDQETSDRKVDEKNSDRHPTKEPDVRKGHDRETSDRKAVDERNRDRHPTKEHDVRKGHDRETSDRKEIDVRNRDRHPTKEHDVRKGHDRETSDRKEIHERNRDRHPTKEHDGKKGHDRETSDRKEKKELSKSHYEELKVKRRRSKSREGDDRSKRSISPSHRLQKRASYHSREDGELASYSTVGRSEWQHSDTDRNKNTNIGSSGQHRRHGGSTSGLGGYSPRKRRSEGGVKTPSPPKRSPEKKRAKWDFVPQGSHTTLAVSVPSNFQLPNKILPLNINVALGTVPIPSNTVNLHPGVSSSIMSTNKNNSIDPVQLTQATRPRRRLYVENIPASASEKAVLECLNNFLISSGVNYVKGTQPCISCIINKEKGHALVEFLTPEDASAALHFDGSFFAGSIIKIRRPKDFVEFTTGEPEKSGAAVETVSNVVKNSPHKIFIGGISKTLSSEMIMEIASTFGPVKAYHFENSDHQNVPHAFLEYADESVTSRACTALNGMKLGGQVLTVLQVYPNSTMESKVNSTVNGIPDHAKPLLENPTQVLKLKNLFDPENLPSLSETEIEEVLEDVRLECVRFGSVKSVNIVKYVSTPISTAQVCDTNDVQVCNVDNDMEFARSPKNLEFDVTNAKTDQAKEASDLTIAKSNGVEDDKNAQNTMGDESRQSGEIDDDISVQNLHITSIPESEDLGTMSKDETSTANDTVIGNTHMEDSNEEGKTPVDADLNLKEASGDIKETLVDDHVMEPDEIEKGQREDQDCNIGYIFEPGCVFVEFGRAEASCTAAHCLHGRLFDNRTVMAGYIPLDVYRSRFSK